MKNVSRKTETMTSRERLMRAIFLTDTFCSSLSRSTSDNFLMDNISLAICDSF